MGLHTNIKLSSDFGRLQPTPKRMIHSGKVNPDHPLPKNLGIGKSGGVQTHRRRYHKGSSIKGSKDFDCF